MKRTNIFTIPLFEAEYPNNLDDIVRNIKELRDDRFGVQKSNNNGFQSVEDLHTHEFMQPIMNFICENSGDAFEAIGNPKNHCVVEGCWYNVNDNLNSHNQMHIHSGTLSGVFYLQAPEGSGNLQLLNTGMNQMWPGHQNSQFRCDANAFHYTVKPKAGMLYLWPSYVYHSVDSNSKDVERISISFNLS